MDERDGHVQAVVLQVVFWIGTAWEKHRTAKLRIHFTQIQKMFWINVLSDRIYLFAWTKN